MIYGYKYGVMDGWCGDEDEIDYQAKLAAGFYDEWYDEYEEE